MSVRQEDGAGFPLHRNNVEVQRITVRLRLSPDRFGQYLRTEKSAFHVFALVGDPPSSKGEPLYRFEYEHAKEAGPWPAAHIQVHGNHPHLEGALRDAGRSVTRSTPASEEGPNIADVHLPVGGTRFRPCLEDVIEHSIHEFRIDAQPGALAALISGRARWRELQLRAAMRDDPSTAVSQLQRMGFNVQRTSRSAPFPREVAHRRTL